MHTNFMFKGQDLSDRVLCLTPIPLFPFFTWVSLCNTNFLLQTLNNTCKTPRLSLNILLGFSYHFRYYTAQYLSSITRLPLAPCMHMAIWKISIWDFFSKHNTWSCAGCGGILLAQQSKLLAFGTFLVIQLQCSYNHSSYLADTDVDWILQYCNYLEQKLALNLISNPKSRDLQLRSP